jgi:Trypsin
MIRVIALGSLLGCAFPSPLPAMVGGAQPASEGTARAVVMLTGSHGTFCSGVALARDLVLTAAHCVLPGATYKLIEFDDALASGASGQRVDSIVRAHSASKDARERAGDTRLEPGSSARAARQPVLKDIASIARHPGFDVNAVLRHRVTADVALLKLAAPLKVAPAMLAPPGNPVAPGDRFVVAGYGLTVRGDGKTGGTVRAATLVATGQPGTLQIRLADPATKGERAGLGACTGDSGAPAFRDIGGTLAVIGVVSWSTGPAATDGCGGLTGVTPLTRYHGWIVEQAGKMGSPLQ